MRLLLLLPLALACAQERRPVIAVGGISHESNSFMPAMTTLADFDWKRETPAAELMRTWEMSNSTLSGYVIGAREHGLELHPTLVTSATPKGPLTREAFETLAGELLRRLQAVPKPDGILLALHGAMVAEHHPHGDEEIVRRVRNAFGPGFPVIVTHDFHANVSEEIVRLSTALITYKQNPHLDTRDRGIQAARIMAGTVRGRLRPVQAVVKPPMIYNIVFQNTYAPPLLPIVEESIRLESRPGILAVSVSGGYQYADVPAVGPSVVVVADNDVELARREAQRLSGMLWATRDQIRLRLPDAASAVRQALRADKFPVALFDFGDNIGGGSAGDSTFLLDELIRQKAQGWVVAIADREAVEAAKRAGIGGAFDMPVGGKTDKLHGAPVRVRGRVRSLHEGSYVETAVRHGGGRYHGLGHAAVIEAEGSTRDLQNLLLLTTQRSSPNSLHQLISVGIYPERQRILTVKGTIAPRAAYEPVAARIVGVDTPGATAVNPARFTFRRARGPLYGLEEPMSTRWAPGPLALTADPAAPHWKDAPRVVADADRDGHPLPEARTEIRSRWTDTHLHFLFVSRYASMHLRPAPEPAKETWGLWDYDVVEVFIGSDLENIGRYKEFEVSPQGEWIDLDVDRARAGKMVDWLWNAGLEAKTRIDEGGKTWYCEMRIPWRAIDSRPPAAGNELRLNLYRIEGPPPNRKFIAWRPVHSPSFHTPEAFGRLRLER